MTPSADLVQIIDAAFERREKIGSSTKGVVREAVEEALALLDNGFARVAEKTAGGVWRVNQWLKKAVLLSFRLNDMSVIAGGPGGAAWWDSAIRKGSRIAILQFGDKIAGYANYGRNRARSLYYDGEIYELYLRPEFQGLGFGRRLFTAARRDLAQSALKSLIVWALSENDNAVEFYRALGGKAVARSSEKFGTRVLDKVAFGWQS